MIEVDEPHEALLLMMVPLAFMAVGGLSLSAHGGFFAYLGGKTFDYNFELFRPIRRVSRWLAPAAAFAVAATYAFWLDSRIALTIGLLAAATFSFTVGLTILSVANDSVDSAKRRYDQSSDGKRRLSGFGDWLAFLLDSSASVFVFLGTITILGRGTLPGGINPLPGLLMTGALAVACGLMLRSARAWKQPEANVQR